MTLFIDEIHKYFIFIRKTLEFILLMFFKFFTIVISNSVIESILCYLKIIGV